VRLVAVQRPLNLLLGLSETARLVRQTGGALGVFAHSSFFALLRDAVWRYWAFALACLRGGGSVFGTSLD